MRGRRQPVDAINVVGNGEEWRNFTPLYVAIMIGSVGATVLKLVLVLEAATDLIAFGR